MSSVNQELLNPNARKPIDLSIASLPLLENEKKLPVEIVSVHQGVPLLNCLVVGASGTGKSTFMKILGNVDFQQKTGKGVIESCTESAEEHKFLIQTGRGFKMVRMIDTPGFSDTNGVSSFALELLISDFIKKGFKELSLVLLAIPYGRRIDASQVETIMNLLKFLGKTLKPVTRILYTFAESATFKDVESYNNEVATSQHTKRIHRFCKGKFHFTGLSNSNATGVLAKFRTQQRACISRVLSDAVSTAPVMLVGEEYKESSAKFVVFEGAGRQAIILKKILPEIRSIVKEVNSLKIKLESLDDARGPMLQRTNSALELTVGFSVPKIEGHLNEWSEVQKKVEIYMSQGNELEVVSKTALELHTNLGHVKKEMESILFDKEIFDSDSDSEG